MISNRDFFEAIGGIVAVVSYVVRLEYRASKNAADVKGLSIRETEHTKHEHRMFILRTCSDIDAAAGGNPDVKRLTDILREAVR